jgi:predicted AAA+ superfamily ATPase
VIEYITRAIAIPELGSSTFFLWGPRQAGKSTLLSHQYADALWIDLLKSEEYRRFVERPELLREEVDYHRPRAVVIDEIQKVPSLLDEVHWLHENRDVQFALCGSSARKLRHGRVNLLGGRGLHLELYGFSAFELGDDFDLQRMLNHGYFPTVYFGASPKPLLDAYVSHYVREEIAAEGLVRRLPNYSQFLAIAALSDGEQVNYSTIARESGVSSETIRGYFEILEDTLLGSFVPSYRRRPKRRVLVSPKFYFTDVGIVNYLARRGEIAPGSELFGKAFENWVFHELKSYNMYRERFAEIHFWRLTTGTEVDFLVNHIDCAIECKSSNSIKDTHLKGLRELQKEHPEVKRRLLVSMDEKNRLSDDGIEIINNKEFIRRLWGGELF